MQTSDVLGIRGIRRDWRYHLQTRGDVWRGWLHRYTPARAERVETFHRIFKSVGEEYGKAIAGLNDPEGFEVFK